VLKGRKGRAQWSWGNVWGPNKERSRHFSKEKGIIQDDQLWGGHTALSDWGDEEGRHGVENIKLGRANGISDRTNARSEGV